MRILHLITNHQVVERTLGIYESVFPGKNEVLVFYLWEDFNRLEKYKGYPNVNRNNVRKVAKGYDFSEITYIVAHYMRMDMIDFIRYAPSRVKVCWEIYGHDLYNQFLEPNGYPLYYSSPADYEEHSFFKKTFPFIFKAIFELKGDKYLFKSQINKQFKYISNRTSVVQYCCRYDELLLEEYSNRKYESYEVFNYSLKEVLGDLVDAPFSSGQDILVGNSASFSNNHLYILDFLKDKIIPEGTCLIMPLSYGGSPKYVNRVESSFRQYFPDNIKTIKDYMPIAEYNQIFKRIRIMVLSAWRQEAHGTAIMGFYMGIKVIMSSRSPLFKWFRECGFIVFDLESINDRFFDPLSAAECLHNRELVLDKYKEENFINNLQAHFI